MEQNHKISYVNLKHTMMSHREYSHRATRASFHPTLGELLKWVEYRRYSYSDSGGGGEEDTTGTSTSQEDGTTTSPSQEEDNTTSPSHQVLELNKLRTSSKSTIPTSYPLVLSFHNLTYGIKTQERTLCPGFLRPTNSTLKILLNSISGQANEGEIMAVLGASGSGKSTLIDALADRISKDSLKGSVRLNGEELESKLLKVISAYVMQEDLLFPMLTVEETLQFSAEFRLPRSVSKSKKKQRVQTLIDQLGLESAANTVIGDEGHRGVSGGERRRVSIGIDIIHDPVILFLDEPTSGLDSTSAYMVVKVLQRIAQSGSIVITSIHQPSYRILRLLDRLIFLSHGHTVYSGSPANLPSFFSEFGHPIPENENRSEFALDLVRELEESPEGPNKLIEFNNSWQQRNHPEAVQFISDNHNKCPSLQDAIRASISKGKLVSGAATSNTTDPYRSPSVSKFANPFWVEVYVIGKRSVTNSRRMPELFAVRFGAILITGIIRATVFYHLDKSPRGAQERLGFFAFAISTTYYTCAEAIPSFLQERDIFKRETSFNAYRLSSYVLSHALISLPALIILSLTFAAVTFSAVSLAGGAVGFLYYFLFILAAFWAGHSFVTFLSGIVTNVVVGFTVVVAVLAYFVLFSGFFMGRDRIPVYWIWFHYLSLVKYPLEGVLQNEFGNPGMCFVRGVQMFDNTPLAAVPEDLKVKLLGAMGNALGVNLTAESCLTTGKDLLRQQGITDLGKMSCLWITLAWGFFFRVLFYLALRLGSRNRRR